MTEKVSTIDVRQRIGDLLNRVALRNDEFIIERKGKPLAALVGVERLQAIQRFARRHALALMKHQSSVRLSDRQAAELAQEAKLWSRGNHKPSRKAKPHKAR